MTHLRSWAPLLLLLFGAPAQAQLALNGTQTIDFNTFTGEGFAPAPAAGQLDSDEWSILGLSDGDLAFGDTGIVGDCLAAPLPTSCDFAHGVHAGGTSTGGVFSFTVAAANQALGVQPTGSDFIPGAFILRVRNDSGATLTELEVSYTVWVKNDQGRASTFNFAHGPDATAAIPESTLDLTTVAAADAGAWTAFPKTITLSGLNIAPAALYYLRWNSTDAGGSGSRDELALDDIVLVSQSGLCGNGNLDGGEFCDNGPNNGGGDGFCLLDCSAMQNCGDDVKNGSEVCDDGADNGLGEGFCLGGLDECTAVQTCGDDVTNGTELCDDGADNDTGEGFCAEICQAVQSCGNTALEGTEVCDIGDTVAGDGCRADCLGLEDCGDGLLDTATGESCDDDELVGGDGCSMSCVLEPGFTCAEGGCAESCGTDYTFASGPAGWTIDDVGVSGGFVFDPAIEVGIPGFLTAGITDTEAVDTALLREIAVPAAADTTDPLLSVHARLTFNPLDPSPTGCLEIEVAGVVEATTCDETPSLAFSQDGNGFDIVTVDLSAHAGTNVPVVIHFTDADVTADYDGVAIARVTVGADKDGDGVRHFAAQSACDCDDEAASCVATCTVNVDLDALPDCRDGCIDRDGDTYGAPGGIADTCTGEDCDDDNNTVAVGVPWYRDADQDGFGLIDISVSACFIPPGFVANADDCDDARAASNPDADEQPGNAFDDDCDGVLACWLDGDDDGYGDTVGTSANGVDCTAVGQAELGGDCDDGAGGEARNPGVPEIVADGIDQDCDAVDLCYRDQDGDGVGTTVEVLDDDLDCDNGSMPVTVDDPGTSSSNFDEDDQSPLVCADTDLLADSSVGDGCDDCAGGTFDPDNDGPDTDIDGECNRHDNDDDDDTVPDVIDNCVLVENIDQEDIDQDDRGDACDPTDDRPEPFDPGTPPDGCRAAGRGHGLALVLSALLLLTTHVRRKRGFSRATPQV